MKCERCGSEQSRSFFHYDTQQWEQLCWPCRKPMVKERARQGTPSKSDPPELGDKEAAPDEDINRQSGISEFL